MTAAATIRRACLGLPLLAALLAGCAGRPPAPTAETPSSQMMQQAQAAAEHGDYAVAARHFLGLAALSKDDASRYGYLLSAAEAFQRGGFREQARQTLHQLPGEALDSGQYARRQVVAAALNLSDQDPRAAVDALRSALRDDTPPPLAIAVHELRAVAYQLSGNYSEAARERVNMAPLLQDPQAVQRNEQALWQSLMSLSAIALESLRLAPPPDTLSGWLELAAIAKTAPALPSGIAGRLAAWRNRYPQHPASPQLLASLQSALAQQRRLPGQVALLLPLSGSIATSAQAIRDGFLAAYEQRDNRDYQPLIRLYDTTGVSDMPALYQQAVQDGAQFVVGPLEKNAIATLRQSEAASVPTLVLNYTDDHGPVPAGLYQFGLAPEDEARMVAERAWLEGHQQALAITPEGEWGGRILRAFSDYWQQLGGTVVASQTYAANSDDLSRPLRRLLNVDASEARARGLRAVLRAPIKFETWRRHDVDFIFMVAFPRQARQIPPQLKFLYAGDLPIYATSLVYDGRMDRAKDRDLDGVTFTDIPWLLTPQRFPLHDRIQQLWPETADQYARLHALGVDAYALMPYLDNPRVSPYEEFPGATGQLVIDDNNRIRRILLWARFRGGTPRLQPLAGAAPH